MIETKACKKINEVKEDDKCQICGELREAVQPLLPGCKRLTGSEFVKRHENTLLVLVVKQAIENGLFPEVSEWYTEKQEHRKLIVNDEKKLYWDWEHEIRTNFLARRPHLTLENTVRKTILLINMVCPRESNKEAK